MEWRFIWHGTRKHCHSAKIPQICKIHPEGKFLVRCRCGWYQRDGQRGSKKDRWHKTCPIRARVSVTAVQPRGIPQRRQNGALKQLSGDSDICEEEQKSRSAAHPSRLWVISSFRLSPTRQVSNWIRKGLRSQRWQAKNGKVVFKWKKINH